MAQKTHTPGTWKAVKGGTAYYPLQIVAEDGTTTGREICSFHSFDSEREANAQLMSKAPIMLQALKAIAARLNGDFDNPALMAYGELSTSAEDDVLNFALAAIQETGN